jgi:hypothetical protein
MVDVSQETRNALTAKELGDLHAEMAALRAQVQGLVSERDRFLRWGVIALGAAVVSLATFIVMTLKGAGRS